MACQAISEKLPNGEVFGASADIRTLSAQATSPRAARRCFQVGAIDDLSRGRLSPVTHLLVGWTALERTQKSSRDRALVVWIGLAPDLDGLGLLLDFATRLFGLPETNYYQEFHRVYGHGLPAALVFSSLVWMLAEHRTRAALAAFVSVHLHFACDLIGSRGGDPEDIWPIPYLSPLSDALTLSWSGQWLLVSWQNTVITAALLGIAAWMAVARGYSPASLFSKNADAAVVAALRARFR